MNFCNQVLFFFRAVSLAAALDLNSAATTIALRVVLRVFVFVTDRRRCV